MTAKKNWKFDRKSMRIETEENMPVAKVVKWASPSDCVSHGFLLAAAPLLLEACKEVQAIARRKKKTLVAVDYAIAQAEGKLEIEI